MENTLSLETIMKDTIWVAKMTYGRHSGTYEEMKHFSRSDECRDFDICAYQPEHLKEFYEAYFNHEKEHGFTTIQEFYKIYTERV